MQFQPFQKIAESSSAYDASMTAKEKALLFSKATQWVATEKLHGANFSIYYCPRTAEARFAKRTGFIGDDEYFYGWDELRGELTEKAAKAAAFALASASAAAVGSSAAGGDGAAGDTYVILYGELCGGFYPPPSPAWEGAVRAGRINSKMQCPLPVEARAVPEGIYYSPSLCFALFDVAIVQCDRMPSTMPPPAAESFPPSAAAAVHSVTFLGVDAVLATAAHAKIPAPQPLSRGSFATVSAFPFSNYDSVFAPQSLGLHTLPAGTNRAEGIVLRPAATVMLSGGGGGGKSGGNAPLAPLRCLIKLKSPAFAEVSGEYSEPSPTPAMRLRSLVNANRAASVLSKHGGRVTAATMDAVVAFMCDDVLEDFYLRFPECAAQAYGEAWDAAQQQLAVLCRNALSGSLVQ